MMKTVTTEYTMVITVTFNLIVEGVISTTSFIMSYICDYLIVSQFKNPYVEVIVVKRNILENLFEVKNELFSNKKFGER